MVTLEEVLVTSMRLLGGAEGAVGREGKGVSHLQAVADSKMCKRVSGMRGGGGGGHRDMPPLVRKAWML